jgi:hypothetical protein
MACSPKVDPCVMRVSAARMGKETQDDESKTETAFAGTDRKEVA